MLEDGKINNEPLIKEKKKKNSKKKDMEPAYPTESIDGAINYSV